MFSVERVLAVAMPLRFREQRPVGQARMIVVCIAFYSALITINIPVTRYWALDISNQTTYESTVGNIYTRSPHWLETWNSVINIYSVTAR